MPRRSPLARLGAPFAAVIAALVAVSNPASAQTPAAPTPAAQTTPLATAPMQTAPMQTAPVQTAPVQTLPVPLQPVQPASVGVTTLAAPDQFSLGGFGPGLGADLWAGSSGAIARAVIPNLSPRALSPAAATLAREALATAAQGAPGAGDDADLEGARLADLLALGDAASVAAIADRSGPALARNETASRAAAEAYLALNRNDAACAVGAGLQSGRDGPYWQRLRSLCLALAGKAGEAQLAFDLANQQGGTNQQGGATVGPRSAFQRLMSVMLAGGGDARPASAQDGIEYAVSRIIKIDLVPAMANAAPAVQAAAAQDASVEPAARLVAAAYAMRANSIPPAAAQLDYAAGAASLAAAPAGAATLRPAAGLDPRRRRRPVRSVDRAPAGLDVRAEAARFAAVQAAPDPAGKAGAVEDLLQHAEDATAFAALSRLVQPQLAVLAAAPPPGERGRLFASAAAAARDFASAQAFRAKLAADGSDAVSAGDRALLDGEISAINPSAPGRVLDQLAEAAAGDPRRATRLSAALALLVGLNDPRTQPAGDETRAAFARADIGPSAAPPAKLLALDAAADAGLKGDTILLALSVAAQSGAGAEIPADRARVVFALARAGLRPAAARLALEGLLELQRP